MYGSPLIAYVAAGRPVVATACVALSTPMMTPSPFVKRVNGWLGARQNSNVLMPPTMYPSRLTAGSPALGL